MNDLTVLIPPFLMCAAVITAIVAFLRHEMGRARSAGTDAHEDNFASVPTAADKLDDDADASASTRRDGEPTSGSSSSAIR
jgi:hypothetical protein